MHLLKAAVVLAVLVVTTMIPASSQDLVAVAPKAAKVVYEDARIRVVRLRIEPNEALPTHDRPRRVIIPLTTSVVNSTRPDGRTGPSRSIAGQAGWGEPGVRSLVNLANPVDNIIVELKQAGIPAKPLAHPPTPAPSNYLEERFHHWAFENQYVRVYDVRLPPGETTDLHVHALDSVTVRISGGLVASQTQGQAWAKAERVEPGSVEVSADASHPKTHRVRNEGPEEYHVALVQLKNGEVGGAQIAATHDQRDSISPSSSGQPHAELILYPGVSKTHMAFSRDKSTVAAAHVYSVASIRSNKSDHNLIRLVYSSDGLNGLNVSLQLLTRSAFGVEDNAKQSDAEFEVVSIKQNKNASGIRLGLWGERFLATGMTLQGLIQTSFEIEEDQLASEPHWVKSESYDVEAKVDHSVAEHLHQLSFDQRLVQYHRMLQTVLADRFKLTFHWETKELPIYALIVVNKKKGSQISEAKSGDNYPNGIKDLNGQGHGDIMRVGRGFLAGQGVSIASLVHLLSQQQLGRHVIDKTGLTAKYDFTLQWTPDTNQGARLKPLDDGQSAGGNTLPAENSELSLFTAIQEQLGFKLRPEKDSVPLLVIDHVERPSAN